MRCGSAARSESCRHTNVSLLIDILTSPDAGRTEMIGRLHRSGSTAGVAELLMDLEEEPAARALVVGILNELQREAGS